MIFQKNFDKLRKKEVIKISKKRIRYPGAIYHIMGRGNRHMDIFTDEEDREYFLALLEDINGKYPFVIHSYCLMTNHYHILIETKENEIWHIMQRLLLNYTKYYNRKYNKDGHLFKGRYKACIVENDEYFLQTSRYIHLNPVRAKMIGYPQDYKWSSYKTMIGMEDQRIVEREKILSYFKKPREQEYQRFVEDVSINFRQQELEIQKMIGEDDLWLPW